MVGIVLTEEQIRRAPPEIQQWVLHQLAQTYGISGALAAPAAPAPAVAEAAQQLARCDLAEAASLFNQVREDRVTAAVLLEFGRDDQQVPHPPGLFGVRIGQMLRDLRLGDPNALAACLGRLTAALQALRHDPRALLFAHGAGCCFVHEETHASLRLLLAGMLGNLVPAQPGTPPGAVVPLSFDAPPVAPAA